MNTGKVVEEYREKHPDEEQEVLVGLDVDTVKTGRLLGALMRLLDNRDYALVSKAMFAEKLEEEIASLRREYRDPVKAGYHAGRAELLEGLIDLRPFCRLLEMQIARKKVQKNKSDKK